MPSSICLVPFVPSHLPLSIIRNDSTSVYSMADPFEVRMRFTNLLSHLSASTTSLIKTAHYALKHRDMDEDLHSCILENLERGHNMNNRANIMYFLEHHADVNLKDGGHEAYVEMVRRDISRIVEAVAQSGANVKVVRRVVVSLGEKGVLETDTVGGIERGLKVKEEKLGKELDDAAVPAEVDKDMRDVEEQAPSNRVTPRTKEDARKTSAVSRTDRKAIEQRIEEDRERHKRLREGVWAVSGDDDQETDKMWEEGSDLGEDDYVIGEEEVDERIEFDVYHRAIVGV
jgi:CTD kinase subunit gamma